MGLQASSHSEASQSLCNAAASCVNETVYWCVRLQADVGVDAGAYARQLMNGAKEEAEADTCKRQDSSLSAPSILQRAYERTTYQGELPTRV